MSYLHPHMDIQQINRISNLGLAHLGDGVYEIMVRQWLCEQGKASSKGLHQATVRYVAAPAQAKAAQRLLPQLTAEEGDVFRRGRNAHVHSVPAHASLEEYHLATGLETLFGYLYLKGELDRLDQLFRIITEEA